MRPMNMKYATSKTQLFLALVVAVTLSLARPASAAAPGMTGTGSTAGTFNLTAQDAYLNQPDGAAVYSWGYGCVSGSSPSFVPKVAFAFPPSCGTMQVPGPTLVVSEGQPVTIKLTNSLPTAAGNTSILFPGFQLTSTCPNSTANPQGLLTCEAAPGATVTYTFIASAPGTHAYYSGTQGDLQVEMGLYGAIIVLPTTPGGTTGCSNNGVSNLYGLQDYGTANHISGFPEEDFRLAKAAYDHPKSCYDREYLFQWAEMDARIHSQAQAQVQAKLGCTAGAMGCSLDVQTEPYHPAYFLINGRSMPDLMDPNYASEYPHQPYNGNPHMHPGELTLIRTIGQGRWQHPFHEHANHVRILARDGNLILSPNNPTSSLAGTLMFNTDTTPGEAFDGIFYFTGRGLNWDPYGHHPAGTGSSVSQLAIHRHQRKRNHGHRNIQWLANPRCRWRRGDSGRHSGRLQRDVYHHRFQCWRLDKHTHLYRSDDSSGGRKGRDGDDEPRGQQPPERSPRVAGVPSGRKRLLHGQQQSRCSGFGPELLRVVPGS